MRKALIYIAAAVVFLFSAGRLSLTAIGSVVPDPHSLPRRRAGFPRSQHLENYDYIFTGKLPTVYSRRASDRSMISAEARQIPHAMLNSAIIAVSVMAVNIV